MADLGSARRVARAGLIGTDGQRWIQAFQGALYRRDHFTDTNGTLLQNHTAASGQAWTKLGGSTDLEVNNNVLRLVSATGNATYLMDGGQADGCLSMSLDFTATPSTDSNTYLHFRGTATTGLLAFNLSEGWTVRLNPDTSDLGVSLFLDGVQVASASTGAAPPDITKVEVVFIGDNIQVWVNGARLINHTSSSRQNETRVGVGAAGLTAGTNTLIDDFFFTELPSCPGAVDVDQIDTWALAPVAAGAELPIHVRWGRRGAPITDTPDRAGLQLVHYDYTGTQEIRNEGYNITVGGSEGYQSFATGWYATSDGTSTGAARAGMFRIRVFQGATGVSDWDIDSENITVLLPAGTSHDFGRGYLVASGGAASVQVPAAVSDPDAAYGETMTLGVTLVDEPWKAALTPPTIIAVQNGTTRHTGTGSNWSTKASSSNDTCDNAYDAASDGIGVRFTIPSAGANNGAEPGFFFSSAPAGYRVTGSTNHIVESSSDGSSFTEDAFVADPRITVDHHMQLNNSSFDAALDKTARLTSDLGFVGFILTNAKGAALANLTATETLVDEGGLVAAVIDRSITTDANGRTPTLASWDSQVPGGGWTHTVDVTSPAGATSLEVTPTATLTLLSNDPSIVIVNGGGPTSRPIHVSPGKDFQAGLSVIKFVINSPGHGDLIIPDSDGASGHKAYISLFRLADSSLGASAGLGQYLDANNVWQDISDATEVYFHQLTQTRAGSGVFIKTWAGVVTASWGTFDVFTLGVAFVNGTPYANFLKEIVVGESNSHNGYALDVLGLAGIPQR